jgi:hypothetical protein
MIPVWALVALPFAVGSVLIVTGASDAFLPHAVFHAVYPIVAASAIVVLLRLRSWSVVQVLLARSQSLQGPWEAGVGACSSRRPWAV